MTVLPWSLLVPAAAGDAYLLLAVALALWPRGRPPAPADRKAWPLVSLLRPLHGLEPGLEERLDRLCRQDYPRWQVVLGVEGPEDPAAAVARRVRERHAHVDVVLSTKAQTLGTNPKVNNLAGMVPLAQGAVLVLSDADIWVEEDYLRRLVDALLAPGVGAVTCLYRGQAADGRLWSQVMAAFVNGWFIPSVRVGLLGRRSAYGLGATLALRRETLDRIGGLQSIAHHLSDDFMLARRVEAHGLRVVLSDATVRTVLEEPNARALWQHLVRWMHASRVVRPWGYGFSWVTYPLALSLLAAVFGAPLPGGLMAVGAAALRGLLLWRQPPAERPPARSLVAVILATEFFALSAWACALLSRRVRWHGRAYRVGPDGEMHPLDGVRARV